MPFLMLSILADVIATAALKSSEGFTRLIPTLIVMVGYGLGFYFLSLSLKVMPVGTAYAVASGLGTALIVLLGALFLKEPLTASKLFSILLIVGGVVGLNLVDKHS
ncbi:DMT family transporter [Deinococcus roseus]|uniref:Multidrug transporter n=1 Tax=Deinococcus roseus TaxID=392414 RepID=A0ABQ2CVP0_9DEIO|nr:multidrug efflux SMR transporter [Deinococcus roseus]GGJ21676.1 multidrug transporter [Deinococcus roseus]